MLPFVPRFSNPHVLTIAGNFWPRKLDVVTYPVEEILYRTEPDVQVLVKQQRPLGTLRGELILLHGLEGSSEGGYMLSMAQAALEAGFVVQRINLRSCGGTEELCPALYHAGLTTDIRAILEQMHAAGREPAWIVGYSLGGNVVLKYAGEMGESARCYIKGVCGVSTPIDLATCVEALARPQNRTYEWRFVRRMRERMRERNRFSPKLFPIDGLDRVRTVFDFDDKITAPYFGFGNAAGYYGTQSAIFFLDAIRVPTLLLSATGRSACSLSKSIRIHQLARIRRLS